MHLHLKLAAATVALAAAFAPFEAVRAAPDLRQEVSRALGTMGFDHRKIVHLSNEQVADIELVLSDTRMPSGEKRDAIERILTRRALTPREEEDFRLDVVLELEALGYQAEQVDALTVWQASELEPLLAYNYNWAGDDVDFILSHREWDHEHMQDFRRQVDEQLERLGFPRREIRDLSWMQLREIDGVLRHYRTAAEQKSHIEGLLDRGPLTATERHALRGQLHGLGIEHPQYGSMSRRELSDMRRTLDSAQNDAHKREQMEQMMTQHHDAMHSASTAQEKQGGEGRVRIEGGHETGGAGNRGR